MGRCEHHKENMKDILGVTKEAYLEVNSRKNKYILMSRHNNAGQYHYKNIANTSKMWQSWIFGNNSNRRRI
jgi:hypothetical protein